ncbi:MAG: hypothetical protein ACOYLI_05005 [Synechococcus lacustris]
MAERHWLDPLARQLLRALGEGPRPQASAESAPAPPPWQIDVNRASRADWLRLPGCMPEQADLLVRLQQGGVQLSGANDLGQLLELPPAQLEAWRPQLLFRWYSEPPQPTPAPVDLNRARPEDLDSLGVFPPDRRARFLRERARRPYAHLADLQERLSLPAAVVEALIGRVSFSPGPGGPALPGAKPGAKP